ncbi:hypothetical protein D3C87_1306010 [compost metagenome]
MFGISVILISVGPKGFMQVWSLTGLSIRGGRVTIAWVSAKVFGQLDFQLNWESSILI